MQDHPTPLQSSMVEKSKHLKMALSIFFCGEKQTCEDGLADFFLLRKANM
jgi:hypothetical protein